MQHFVFVSMVSQSGSQGQVQGLGIFSGLSVANSDL